MKNLATAIAATLLLLLPTALAFGWVRQANHRMVEQAAAAAAEPQAAVAQNANAGYCTPELKQILRRVLQSCGLLQSGGVRGCQPADAAQVAALSGGDFNASTAVLRSPWPLTMMDTVGASSDTNLSPLVSPGSSSSLRRMSTSAM